MALHGSAAANLSPILFKGNNRSLGVNVIIHQDQSGSMSSVSQFYSNGTFVGALQDALLAQGIGDDSRFPNLYAYFGVYSRNPSTPFTITNAQGSLTITQSFIKGESSGAETIAKWIGNNYFNNVTTFIPNICTDLIGSTTGGRLVKGGVYALNAYPGAISEDVHGNLWSIYTTPNAISTGIPGRYGSVIGSNVRKGSTNIIVTNSNEQSDFWGPEDDMIGELVTVGGGTERTINGANGEMNFRKYRVFALSSYSSTDGYSGVLFYGSTSPLPYGYVTFTGESTYTITRSATFPNWVKSGTGSLLQLHDTLTLASETRGALFKDQSVFTNTGTDRRVAFSNCIAQFIADTV